MRCHYSPLQGDGMILGTIDFPDELVASIVQGRCVVFAGAGVSKGQPAGLWHGLQQRYVFFPFRDLTPRSPQCQQPFRPGPSP